MQRKCSTYCLTDTRLLSNDPDIPLIFLALKALEHLLIRLVGLKRRIHDIRTKPLAFSRGDCRPSRGQQRHHLQLDSGALQARSQGWPWKFKTDEVDGWVKTGGAAEPKVGKISGHGDL